MKIIKNTIKKKSINLKNLLPIFIGMNESNTSFYTALRLKLRELMQQQHNTGEGK